MQNILSSLCITEMSAAAHGGSMALSLLNGQKDDLMYASPESCKVEAIPVEYNTRYVQDLANKTAGQSTLVIPPGNCVKNIVLTLGFNAGTLAAQTGSRVLPRGWGYRALRTVSWRVGGSSQFFLSGAQLLQRNMRMVSTQSQADAILSLGGEEVVLPADFAKSVYAYIPLSFFVPPQEGAGLTFGVAGDLLSQQIVITTDLAPSSEYFSSPCPAFPGGDVIPNYAFDTANWTVEQHVMVDRGMSLASQPGVNLMTHQYSAPLNFDQQAFTFEIPRGSTGSIPLTASGFRAGLCNSIQLYLQEGTAAGASASQIASANANLGRYVIPDAVQVLYAGVIYANYQNKSSAIWSLVTGSKPAAANTSEYTATSGVGWTSAPALCQYVALPFGNPVAGSDHEAEVLCHGKAITNGIVNLQITVPDSTKSYTATLIYNYTAALSYSAGTAEVSF